MVFITGPRQVGKTSLALAISENFEKSLYLNYDNFHHREVIRNAAWLPDTKLLILDEIHKMENWENFLKGIYDTKPRHQQILVTGSARLETFRQSGDSLVGRFFRHRLNPLSLARDIKCSPNTIKRYVEILESLFIVFRVTPFHRNIGRSLLKEPKIYFYDTGMVLGDEGIRLENLVAVSLLKHLNWTEDCKSIRCELMTLRTKEKKEVDFVMVENNKPKLIVEVKLSDTSISPSLRYFHNKYALKAAQVVKNINVERMVDGLQLRRTLNFLKELSI